MKTVFTNDESTSTGRQRVVMIKYLSDYNGLCCWYSATLVIAR